MEILKGTSIIDLGLFLKKHKTLIVSDLHIGYEEALNKQGVLVPRFMLKELSARLEEMLKLTKPDKVVINGDLKHEFGRISEQEWRDTLKILDLIAKHTKDIVLVKGNHDMILGPIAKKRDVRFVDDIIIGDYFVTHGDKIKEIPKETKTIIIGNEHPAIGIREGNRTEKFKCFLLGKWKKSNLIVLPSMNMAIEGSDIQNEDILSPYLEQKLSNFEAFVVADKVYNFGRLKDLR
jgi:putative SbcD/Mre11-related phosphoesterase